MGTKRKLKMRKWDLKRKRLKYHLKKKNINNVPRLIVIRSNNNIFTQLVDDVNSKTILSVSSIDKEIKEDINKAKIAGMIKKKRNSNALVGMEMMLGGVVGGRDGERCGKMRVRIVMKAIARFI